jgi:hypothetical protein
MWYDLMLIDFSPVEFEIFVWEDLFELQFFQRIVQQRESAISI